jgi:hypothetical protein
MDLSGVYSEGYEERSEYILVSGSSWFSGLSVVPATAASMIVGRPRLRRERRRHQRDPQFAERAPRGVAATSRHRLHSFRRLRIRYERSDELHTAFLKLGAAVICQRLLP